MSKYVKNLISDYLRQRLNGVDAAFLVNVSGLTANQAVTLRSDFRSKNIELLMIKNSLARRATEGTPLAPAFEGVSGSTAVVFGGEDVVFLAKEIVRVSKEKQYAKLVTTGGVLDGTKLSPEQVEAVSKWPSRAEQLSILAGQILAPGANLAAALRGPGGALASQIKKKSEGAEEDAAGEAAPAEAGSTEAAAG